MARSARFELDASALGSWVAICAAVWLVTHPSFAQAPQSHSAPVPPSPPQQQQQVQPPQQPDAPRKREGFLDAVGRWFDKSARDFKASVDEANAKWRASVEETNARLKASAEQSNARWKASVDESNAKWRELGQRTEKAAKEAAAAQKEAADAFKNLANIRMVEGRQVCEPAPNGSPDCQAAAEVICKGKGFATGKSADVQTARKCSARALLHRDDNECRTETVVIKAACQ